MSVKQNKDTKEYFFEEGCYITELWNSPQDENVSIARARLPAGRRTLPHRLNDTTERYIILSGAGRVFLTNDPPRTVVPDDVVLIKPGQIQYIENTGQNDLVFLAICSPRFSHKKYQAVSL